MHLVQRSLFIAIPARMKVESWSTKSSHTVHMISAFFPKMKTAQVGFEFRKQEEVIWS